MKNLQFILFATILAGLLYSCGNNELESSAGTIHYTHRKVDLNVFGPAFLSSFNEKLYNAVIDGKIPAYTNDSLTEYGLLSTEDAKLRGSYEEVIQIAVDPEYPDYIVDTTISNLFRIEDIKGYEISEAWIYNKGSNIYQAQPSAFALRYTPFIAGIYLPEQSLFWIDHEDLSKVLSNEDLEKLKELLFIDAVNKLSDY
ncbi:hypothetical protein ACFLRI_02595 [Bacteroidota bacterium]